MYMQGTGLGAQLCVLCVYRNTRVQGFGIGLSEGLPQP